MIQVLGFIEKENVGEPQKEQHRCSAIPQPQDDCHRQNAEDPKVDEHPCPRPGMHPTEAIISKKESGLDEISVDPFISKIAAHFHQHENAERNAEQHQRLDSCGCEQPHPPATSESGRSIHTLPYARHLSRVHAIRL